MVAFNYGGKILNTSKVIKAVIQPELFDLQDSLGHAIDSGRDIYIGMKAEFAEPEK